MAAAPGRPGSGRNGISDLRGATRLVIEATRGVTDVVESMHHNIARVPAVLGSASGNRTRGLTGLVYRSVHGVTRLVGGGLDALMAGAQGLAGTEPAEPAAPWRENAIAVINGVLGDHLEATGNPLAIQMSFRREGRRLDLDRPSLAAAIEQPGDHLLVLIHGLCMNDLQWRWKGHDHGRVLAAAIGCTPLYVHYNTGRHISLNGRDLAEQLDRLLAAWPVPVRRLSLLTHSMGGLVARSAWHQARLSGQAWPDQLSELFFLGTPHHGAPLERGGHIIDLALGASPYSAALARLGQVRSAGITDLRHGSLVETDWLGADRFARGAGRHIGLPLPDGAACYALAATTSRRTVNVDDIVAVPASARGYAQGDGLVPLRSALGVHKDLARTLHFAAGCQRVVHGTGHLDLLGSAEVCEIVRGWMAAGAAGLRR